MERIKVKLEEQYRDGGTKMYLDIYGNKYYTHPNKEGVYDNFPMKPAARLLACNIEVVDKLVKEFKEIKTLQTSFITNMKCTECDEGIYKFNGKEFESLPPRCCHTCDKCGHSTTFDGKRYPIIEVIDNIEQ